ncbi:hypothetical protein ACFV7Q_26480 [Streptomyces sp. NPDC059851]|uniref:hypothetical protein n=1 Tax=Streptomyces sp. NPDC059851 TaxID=3346971 RepID=UPI0036480A90
MAITTASASHASIAAFGVGTRVRLRACEAHSTGFRGFTLGLRPGTGCEDTGPVAGPRLLGRRVPAARVHRERPAAGGRRCLDDELELHAAPLRQRQPAGVRLAGLALTVSRPVKVDSFVGLAKDLGVPADATGSRRIVLSGTPAPALS